MSHGTVPDPVRIVLVGFMASGKSTVGPRLADRLGWRFVDLDDLITRRTGRSPGEWIRDRGEPAFRSIETDLTAEVIAGERVVLAPGGGWVTRPELQNRLPPGTVRVWLRIGVREALRRAAADDVDRPLLGPPEGRLERAGALLAAREPLYAAAEIVVSVDGKKPAVVVDEILERLALDGEEHER